LFKSMLRRAGVPVAFALLCAVVLPLASVIRPAHAAAPAAAATVKIGNFNFGPKAIDVPVGATVTWVNEDDAPHTVTAGDGSFRSRTLDTGEQFSFTFAKPGEYGYFCSIHPMMTGKVVVRAA